MPHFIIDCSEEILDEYPPEKIMEAVYEVAKSSKLFDEVDIKVRIRPHKHYMMGAEGKGFVHIFGYLMERCNPEQKTALSKGMVTSLHAILPDLAALSSNIREFKHAGYWNKFMLGL